ncbi:MAG TPA: DNA mismatch repair endonuclease MutL [Gemmatimonadaceae bacterium]|nr:DNA mismatch repair endonuclease MutL [Gemmatimonadaceae bacterium]
MPRIAILPADVADQIAAGEVVERPSSVVKELIENSLDAGATSIEIIVEEGGHKLIRVSDDGSGMSADDVRVALVRHGTSKIRSAADLVGVSSFGFRGEALPAIASISRFAIETSPSDADGAALTVSGGTVQSIEAASRRRGTTVTVGQLFYNVPARKKFLRSARSEWRAIVETVAGTALTRMDIRFTLSHDGKLALALPPVSSLRARISGIWGGKYAASLLDVDDVSGTFHTSGLVERPADVGTATRRVFISVNGRPVRDIGIVRAAEAAYRSTIAAGLRPSLYLDVTVPAESVDVNVHPAKAEIRFTDKWPVERAVETAVRRALGTFDASASMGYRRYGVNPSMDSVLQSPPVGSEVLSPRGALDHGLFSASSSSGAVQETSYGSMASGSSADTATANGSAEIPELFQFRRTYIAFEHADGMVLIDQHSAHERVLFEQFMTSLETGRMPAQRLLLPITLHLGPAEGDAFEANREYLERIGFEIEGFGGSTLIVSSVPMPHRRFDAERCLRETLDALTGDRVAGTATRHEHLAATVACKAAIKAGDALSTGEMRALFASLRDTTLPAHDVHGRSTIVQLTWDELDRRFGRK